jgi:hypothetical protein
MPMRIAGPPSCDEQRAGAGSRACDVGRRAMLPMPPAIMIGLW